MGLQRRGQAQEEPWTGGRSQGVGGGIWLHGKQEQRLSALFFVSLPLLFLLFFGSIGPEHTQESCLRGLLLLCLPVRWSLSRTHTCLRLLK